MTRPMRFMWMVLLATPLLYGAVAAQQIVLRGVVVDEIAGLPLYAAHITAASDRNPVFTASALDGRFALRLSKGTYQVYASYVGFFPSDTLTVEIVGEEDPSPIRLGLLPGDYLLNPVVVTASRQPERRIDAPATINLISGREIQTRQALTPTDHLKGLPDVDIISTGLTQDRVAVRGFNGSLEQSARLLMMTDYRIANLPALRMNMAQLIPSINDDIDRIETAAGPGSAVYGPNAAGGVMHVFTKSPFLSPETSVGVRLGERDVWGADGRHAAAINQGVAYKVSGSFYRGRDWEYHDPAESDSISLGVRTPDGRTEETPLQPNIRDFDIEKLGAEAALYLRNDRGALGVLSAGYAQTSNIELTDIGAWQARDWSYAYLQARFSLEELFVQAYVNRVDAGGTFNLRSGDLSRDKSIQWVGQVQHGLTTFGGRQRFTYGADAFLTRPNTEKTIYGRNESDDSINELGVYAHSETDLASRFRLVAAARLDDHNRLKSTVFSPRAALVYRHSDEGRFRITYNRAYESPLAISLFSDFMLAPSLGPLPFALRIKGVPAETGHTFPRDANGGIGGLYMQSPFTPEVQGGRSAFVPAEATGSWPAIVGFLQSQGVDLSGIPVPDSDRVRTELKLLDPNTASFLPATPSDVADIPPLKPRKSTALEVGYEGVIGEKLSLNVTLFKERDVDFSGPFLIKTPNVFYDQGTLQTYLSGFLPSEDAAVVAGIISGIPVGTVTSEQGDPADIMFSTRSFGSAAFYGGSTSLTYHIDRRWSVGGNYSYLSKNLFVRGPGEAEDRTLNAPRHKFGLGIRLHDSGPGLAAHLRLRYVDGFPIISGLGNGSVSAYTLLDLSLAYDLPVRPDVSFSVSVSNLLDNRHREYVQAPDLGRHAMMHLTYRFSPKPAREN